MFPRLFGRKGLTVIAVGAAGAGLAYGVWNGSQLVPKRTIVRAAAHEHGGQTRRHARFDKFASCSIGEEHLMTPADFLESLIHNNVPGWTRKKQLTNEEVADLIANTPSLSKGSSTLFRTLQENGIITYPEYLFLITILTKSKHGLEIAFRMLDKDGNKRLCKDEFLVLEEMVNKKATAKSIAHTEAGKEGPENTTLLTHFFTSTGNGQLTFDQFSKFMLDLQVEVSELEFMEYSRGLPTIPEESFARLLLRNTDLSTEKIQEYIDRLNSRMNVRKAITQKQYVNFILFLNNLDDFAMAMRVYSIAGQPVTQDEFQRAVRISTGHTIDPYVIHTIFQLFDIDGDGKLSQHEFIELMKNRQKRGFKTPAKEKPGWEGFKGCVKKEMSF